LEWLRIFSDTAQFCCHRRSKKIPWGWRYGVGALQIQNFKGKHHRGRRIQSKKRPVVREDIFWNNSENSNF